MGVGPQARSGMWGLGHRQGDQVTPPGQILGDLSGATAAPWALAGLVAGAPGAGWHCCGDRMWCHQAGAP